MSATRASPESTGWQVMNIRRSRSSPMSSSSASSGARLASRAPSSSSRASSSCLRSSRVRRRSRSMARCLAACISHAPGLRGTPDAGHCSRAATSASCARSSAAPTSRTRRISPAISFGDSRRHTASMAVWESAVTPSVRIRPRARSPRPRRPAGLNVTALVGIRVRAAAHPLDHFGLRPALQDPEAGNQLLGFGERTVHHRAVLAVESDARALRAGLQTVAGQHHACLDELLVERAISASCSGVGITPASESFVALTITMKRI